MGPAVQGRPGNRFVYLTWGDPPTTSGLISCSAPSAAHGHRFREEVEQGTQAPAGAAYGVVLERFGDREPESHRTGLAKLDAQEGAHGGEVHEGSSAEVPQEHAKPPRGH